MDFSEIRQIIGCAYTYQGSLGVRKRLTASLREKGIHHSSQERDFSYFYKGNSETVVGDGADLKLRDEANSHWPEAELAIVLGQRHQIIGYTLANDFTAIDIEAQGRTQEFDGTYFGKVWKGSCSLGPTVISSQVPMDNLEIRLRIERDGKVIYDNTYNTSRRRRNVDELAELIVKYHSEFGSNVPPSKRIQIENGFLAEGTVILAGTGLIVPERCYSQKGDYITVSSQSIEKLRNRII